MVFRGQRLSTWELIPSAFRKDVLARVKHGMFAMPDPDHPAETFFEFGLLNDFLHFCDARGLTVPGDSPAFREYMHRGPMYIHSIQNRQWPDAQIRPLMALAQHHGVPTRLLDVTNNPHVAAYFAASSTIESYFQLPEGQQRVDYVAEKRMAVFGIDVGTLHMVAGIEPVRVAGSTSPNLSAQGGSFLLVEHFGARGERFEENASIEKKIESIRLLARELNTPVVGSLLTKITLPVANAQLVLNWCGRHGINAATVFPGYDGAAAATLEFTAAERFAANMKALARTA